MSTSKKIFNVPFWWGILIMGEDSHEWKQEGVWEIFLPSSQFCWAPNTALEHSLQRKIPCSFLVITLQKNQSHCHLRRWKKNATMTRCCDGKDGGEKSGCHGGWGSAGTRGRGAKGTEQPPQRSWLGCQPLAQLGCGRSFLKAPSNVPCLALTHSPK